MKKSLFLFVLLFNSFVVFANTKIYLGGCNFTECYSSEHDYTKAVGIEKKFGADISIDSSYKYIEENMSVVVNDTYFHIENDLKLKWNVFYIGSCVDYSTRMFKKNMCNYADVCVGLKFDKEVFDWLTVGGDFKFGYTPLNIIGSYDNSNNFVTALKLNVDVLEYVHLYCGVECIETKKESVFFNPLTVKNTIGIKAEYFWNDFGVYGSVDYFCLHPEHGYEYNLTDVNQNRTLMSVGMVKKF